MRSNSEKIIYNNRLEDVKLLIFGILVGVVAGAFSSFYRYIIHGIEDLLKFLIAIPNKSIYLFFLMSGVCLILAIVVGYIKKFEPLCGGSGIPQVKAELKGYVSPNPLKVLFAKILGGALTALAGLSVGREGPSIQIGAMSGKWISQLLKREKLSERFLITCGASAGLAGAFNAPVAGILFSIEEVHRHISKKLLITIMAASISSDIISKSLYGTHTVFKIELVEKLYVGQYWHILLFGLILSVLGVLYLKLMSFFMKVNDGLKLPVVFKMLPYFILPVILFFFVPQVLGGGGVLMESVLKREFGIELLLILFAFKILFAIISFTSGVPGGIFFPILVLGAIIGSIYGQIFDSTHVNSFIILGMAGYLTAIVRAPLTSIILIFEMTGNLEYLLPLSMICLITYALPNYLNSLPVYEYLLERLLDKQDVRVCDTSEKMIMNLVVDQGSEIENHSIKEVGLLKDTLIVNIDRSGADIIPNGNTLFESGDVIQILISENELYHKFKELQAICEQKN